MHLRPDRLRAHAAVAAELAGALEALGRAPGSAADSIDSIVLRARRELAEVEAVLRGAAGNAEAADHAVAAVLERIVDRL
jgi:hypothetical protein